ncbi:MAG: hypothetical protein LBB73_02830 [Dysgonamonadaceae bacterium]|jgi:hypothetical protein|nr:hypothetical protein [Dysgonamonadaceae bacterium]
MAKGIKDLPALDRLGENEPVTGDFLFEGVSPNLAEGLYSRKVTAAQLGAYIAEAHVPGLIEGKAPLESPEFTGTPKINGNNVATEEYVSGAISAIPAIPQEAGEYKLVVDADGNASFQLIE